MQFNLIAKYYYIISRIAFGNDLEVAKISLLRQIPTNTKVLMIGGGTGRSLKHLLNINSSAKIDFVESSIEMVELAQLNIKEKNRVSFICEPIEMFDGEGYDVIITEFFLDLFSTVEIENHIAMINQKLLKGGFWIDTDFRPSDQLFHKLLIKIMYLFFSAVSNVKAKALVELEPFLKINGFITIREVKFKSGFITSRVFARS